MKTSAQLRKEAYESDGNMVTDLIRETGIMGDD